MNKKDILKAYKIAHDYTVDHKDNFEVEDLVNIGMQMAISGEVLFKEDSTLHRID